MLSKPYWLEPSITQWHGTLHTTSLVRLYKISACSLTSPPCTLSDRRRLAHVFPQYFPLLTQNYLAGHGERLVRDHHLLISRVTHIFRLSRRLLILNRLKVLDGFICYHSICNSSIVDVCGGSHRLISFPEVCVYLFLIIFVAWSEGLLSLV